MVWDVIWNVMSKREGSQWLAGFLFGWALLLIAPARAEVVPDLYAVGVPVAEQSQSELQRAAAAGLRELAVRISGRSSAAGDAALSALFANPTRYLEQYRYERNTGSESPWLAQLRFAAAPIDNELRRAGLPIWGGNRPALQTLIAVDDQGARALIDDNSPLAPVLREQWRRRGLVLHLPNSAGAINIDDVMTLDAGKIAANTHEHVDGFLLARIALTADGACDSHWSLSLGPQPLNADAAGSAFSTCVAAALDRLVDNFSAQYAVAANSGAEGIVLRVTGIVSFDDYAALLNYLRRLAAVKNAQPVLVRGDEILFQLKIAGGSEQLARQFALESRLSPTENPASISAPLPVALSYRWLTRN